MSRVRDVALMAIVSGSAAAPDIALSSVPELPQDEIWRGCFSTGRWRSSRRSRSRSSAQRWQVPRG